MFTGIVEIIGQVVEYCEHDKSVSGGDGTSITIGNAGAILGDVHLGDSIAVNGTCLTVTEFTSDTFKVGVSPETLRRTNLGDLKKGDPVNLERAISGEVRFGGHFVQGHVDTVAEIVKKEPDGNSISFTFRLRDAEYLQYIVEKGFICVDGTSLTVTGVSSTVEDPTFSIMLVAYTQEKVIMPRKSVGDLVNIEVDLMGKLIEKQIGLQLAKQIGSADSPLVKMVEKIVTEKVKALEK